MLFKVWARGFLFSGRLGVCLVLPAVLLLLLLLLGTAQAQVLYGSLTGIVLDPSGGAVPNATVTTENIGTGATKEVASDERGSFLLNNLQPGMYRVTISAKGFGTLTQDGIGIDANAIRRLDVTLKLSEASSSIVVTAEAVGLQTDRADVNTQLQATQIANLPLTSSAGRNFQALYKIIPGFSVVTEGVSSDGGNPQRSMTANVNGNSMQANLTRIDGASNAYIWLPFNAAYVPPTESIQSVNVVTNSYDAEQGNAHGAAVNVVTKSGTNEFHGSAFEFHTDNALKALNRFNPSGFRKPKFILNQYGGAVGGPIMKNKLFFFTDWEATKRRMLASRSVTVINPDAIFDSAGNANLAPAIPAGTDLQCNARSRVHL